MKDRKRAEEILAKRGFCTMSNKEKAETPSYFINNIIDAMIEFASLPVVTDEEIERMAIKYFKDIPNYFVTKVSIIKGYKIGAMQMRDRLQPVGKTEQLKESSDEEKTKGE